MDCSMPGFPVYHQLPEIAQTHVHRVSDAIQPCHPLSSPSPPAFNLSQHQSPFQWIHSSHQVAKVLELPHQFFQWIFRVHLPAVQGTVKSSPTPQFKSINSSALNFMVQLSHPYMTTGKTIALTRRSFVGKVMSLLFNMLSRLVIAFLSRSKCLLSSCL